MDRERWARLKALLDACGDIEPKERSAWLDSACPDPDLRREAETYLAYEEQVESFDDTSASPVALALDALGPEVLDPEPVDETGRRIGPYRLEELIGHGGMGSVYRARREAEFEQKVAIKLVRTGLETPETVERFHQERQILARLQHESIARLLDGGTADGRPYFVMELIDGVPIDRYCEDHRLGVRARLQLISRVAGALAFAHRNLVLHLDLKPGNILVTENGTPKLLDFGIGELLARSRDAVAPSQRRLTLAYASPEQIAAEPLATSSDLYSLGVVLYELLTGRLPCGTRQEDSEELAQAVQNEPPLPPSIAVLDQGDGRALGQEAIELRGERSPRSLHRRLQGDLDAILLQVLAKDPSQRYDSADHFARDLRRHLTDHPVEARGHHPFYRTLKFLRRNRWGVAAIALMLSLVLGFTAALTVQLGRTERQRQHATRLSDFLVGLFRAAEPDRAGTEPSVRELVDLGRQRLEHELEDDPQTRSQLLGTLGQVYYRLGHYDEAEEAQVRALALLRERFDDDRPEIARALNDLAVVAYTRGLYPRAEDYARRSIAMRRRLGDDADLLKPRNTLASILMLRGQLSEAGEIYSDILAERRAHPEPTPSNIAVSLRNLATVHYLAGRFALAQPLLQESLALRLEVHGRESASVATALASLGRLAHARGDLEEAERHYLESLTLRRRLLGEDSLHVALLRGDLARLMVELGELDTAAILFGHAFRPLYHHRPAGDWSRADLESAYGAYLAARGHPEAEACLREGWRVLYEVRGPNILPTRQALERLEHFTATAPK